ncbi:MAG: outer membrane family protein [Alphaproteobacteria bacterium]|nr:MAG: outer membrane family protein [Alphaproteobacteria bacterium]
MKYIAILAFFLLPSLALAEDVPATDSVKIAVVDIQQLMGASKAAKSIQSQGKSLRNKFQKKIKKIEDDLKKTEKKLVSLAKGDSQADFEKKKKEFQKKLINGQKEAQELNKKLDKALGNALNKLRDQIVKIVGNISTDNGYDLVISRADVVIVSKKIDITADVMKKLNKKLSTVKVKG